jgi:hypothetical protein
LSYVYAAARDAGFVRGRVVDANIDGLNYLAAPERVEKLIKRCEAVRCEIESRVARSDASRGDLMRYRAALTSDLFSPSSVGDAINVFRTSEFYQPASYRRAVAHIKAWMSLLTIDVLPGLLRDFGPDSVLGAWFCDSEIINHDLFRELVCGDFRSYFDEVLLPSVVEEAPDIVGLSVNYSSQLAFALDIARGVRRVLPSSRIVFGGTEVSDVLKYASSRSATWTVFSDADMIVVGEGESTFVELLQRFDPHRIPSIRGLVVAPRHRPSSTLFPETPAEPRYEDLNRFGPPDYSVWNWSAYWSPEPVILYSPTRGCYWNKCTFCDYGLNSDSPTSPSRERSPELLENDLRRISEIANVVYFAVDAMSPRFLRRLADVLTEGEIALSWSAELRLERKLDHKLGERLRGSGCVAISFGFESGSQRVLDLIDKGVELSTVPGTLRALADCEIGAQLMGFIGFPTESDAEAQDTFRFLVEHEELWALSGIGRFSLTPGAIVAKQPDRFGVVIFSDPAVDIHRTLRWGPAVGGSELPADSVEVSNLAQQVARAVFDRPFAGGIDAGHTLLYFRALGTHWVHQFNSRLATADDFRRAASCTSVDDAATLGEVTAFLSEDSARVHSPTELLSWLDERADCGAGDRVALVLPNGKVLNDPLASATDSLKAALLDVLCDAALL